MRTPALVASIATAGLVVAVSGVIAAVVVDEDDRGDDARRAPVPAGSSPSAPSSPPADPPVSVRPSATSVLTPAPSAPTTTRAPAAPSTPGSAPGADTGAAPGSGPSAPSTSPAPRATPSSPAPPPRGGRTYVVRPGDTLSEIAEWFRLMGFERLYDRNRDVIGSDPDLIKPGQRFTISATGALVMSRG